ncbi:MAG: hypothetical protein Tsb002_19150 [Wenzhouxiangellaceae bacterium]
MNNLLSTIPKWLFAASFTTLILLFLASFVLNRPFRIAGSPWGFYTTEPARTEILKLDGTGNDIELNDADKTYYSSESCPIGEIRAASMINDRSESQQTAICVCMEKSAGNNTGRGWYCLN